MSFINPLNGLTKNMDQMHKDISLLREELRSFRKDLRILVKALNDNTRAIQAK